MANSSWQAVCEFFGTALVSRREFMSDSSSRRFERLGRISPDGLLGRRKPTAFSSGREFAQLPAEWLSSVPPELGWMRTMGSLPFSCCQTPTSATTWATKNASCTDAVRNW